MKIDDFVFLVYLSVVSFIAGVIGLINRAEHKQKESLTQKIMFLVFGGVSSVLIGFVVFEVAFFYFENQRLGVAISAFCSWMGTRLLLELHNRVLEFIQNYKR